MPENFIDLCHEFIKQLEQNRELYEKTERGEITDNAEGWLLVSAAVAAKEALEAEIRRRMNDPAVPEGDKAAGAMLILAYDAEQKKKKEEAPGNDAEEA